MPAPGSPSPHPARGAEPSPSRNKSPFSPACPAETLFRSHPPGSQRALTARRGEPGGLGRADRAARAGSRHPPSPAPALQPPRGHPGVPPPCPPAPHGGHAASWRARVPACRRGERPFNCWQRMVFLVLLLHNSGFDTSKGQNRASPGRRGLQRTQRETSTNTPVLYMHAHFFLCFFVVFFLLSWREQRDRSQEKQISPTIPFRKFHFKPNQMMAAALRYV